MEGFNIRSYLEFYVPLNLEEQLGKYSDKEGNHSFDFRIKETNSEIALKRDASFIWENVPFVLIPASDSLEFYPGVLPSKFPRVPKNTGKTRKGEIDPHVSGFRARHMGVNFDYAVKLPNASEFNNRAALTIVSGYYLTVEEGVVTGYSEALIDALEKYFVKRDSPSSDFEYNLSKLSLSEFFGSYLDKDGLKGCYFPILREPPEPDSSIFGSTKKFLERGGSPVNKIRDLNKGSKITWEGESSRLTGIVVLLSNDPGIINPHFKAMSPVELTEMTEGGGTTITDNFNNELPTGVSLVRVPTEEVYYNKTNQIEGKGRPGVPLVLRLPKTSGGFIDVDVTPSEEDGSWSVELPEGVSFKNYEATRTIKIREKTGDFITTGSSTTTIIEPTKIKEWGIPLYTVKMNWGGSFKLYDNRPTIAERLPPSTADEGGTYFSSGYSVDNLNVGGFYAGPPQIDKGFNKVFINSGDTVITDLAITFFVAARPEKTSQYGYAKIFDVVLGKKPLESRQIAPNYSLYWIRYGTASKKLQYKARFRKNYEHSSLTYNIRWRRGREPVKKALRYRSRWMSHLFRKRSLVYTTRYKLGLTDKITYRSFYVFEWMRSNQLTYAVRYSSKWRSTLSRTKNFEYKVSWKTNPVEPVIVRPFYIKTQDPKTRVWTEKISFQVYGNPEIIQDYIADNNLWFYFSNPDKFEIIKFNYNMLPYANIFLEELKDSSLEELEGIPDNYHLVGNYTISGINNINSVSLDVVGGTTQLNEAKSFWIPMDINDWDLSEFSRFSDKSLTYVHKLDERFRDDHHEDVVELDLIILNDEECCFTQKSSGSRCSPY